MKILLGLTGSVATVLYKKLIQELQTVGDVEVIVTEHANSFLTDFPEGIKVWRDEDEWKWIETGSINATIDGVAYSRPMNFTSDKWKKNDRVLHIDLRDQASALVIAPCSANTLGKITNGICDNLLTSVARAWDPNRPFIIAPAMNTHMWNHPLTERQLREFGLFSNNNRIVHPQSKMLACNTKGMGALAEIDEIVNQVKASLRWEFPLHDAWQHEPKCSGIPQCGHPGAFLTKRKNHTHTGVDLYTTDGQFVHAVEDGIVVSVEDFTGTSQQSPWWEDTQCILIEGASGVVCYGEISVNSNLRPGHTVQRGQFIGRVKRVLKPGKERPDIDGHSPSMLHMEIYKHGTRKAFEENPTLGDVSDWSVLIDPTPFLMNAKGRPIRLLKYEHI